MFKNSQKPPFYIFRHYATYQRPEKSFCYFWALDMAPTCAGSGLFNTSVSHIVPKKN